jgi:hypothetical protein
METYILVARAGVFFAALGCSASQIAQNVLVNSLSVVSFSMAKSLLTL